MMGRSPFRGILPSAYKGFVVTEFNFEFELARDPNPCSTKKMLDYENYVAHYKVQFLVLDHFLA
jgi:hypothetical protein